MSLPELSLVAVSLSMDAFAVSISKGLSLPYAGRRHMLAAGFYFGIFQAGMPVLGYLVYRLFQSGMLSFAHWIASILLCAIGGSMMLESFHQEELPDPAMDMKTMLLLAIATSIDAFAAGVSFGALQVSLWLAVALIGCTTFIFSIFGIKIGSVFGGKYKARAELAGGLILIGMGIKILLEHLFFGK